MSCVLWFDTTAARLQSQLNSTVLWITTEEHTPESLDLGSRIQSLSWEYSLNGTPIHPLAWCYRWEKTGPDWLVSVSHDVICNLMNYFNVWTLITSTEIKQINKWNTHIHQALTWLLGTPAHLYNYTFSQSCGCRSMHIIIQIAMFIKRLRMCVYLHISELLWLQSPPLRLSGEHLILTGAGSLASSGRFPFFFSRSRSKHF